MFCLIIEIKELNKYGLVVIVVWLKIVLIILNFYGLNGWGLLFVIYFSLE